MALTESLVEQIWKKENLAAPIIEHCKTVEKSAMQIAERLVKAGIKVNLNLVKFGALLHDIGRAKDHSVRQGITGYEILQKYPEVPEEVRLIVKYHVGAGITEEEAIQLKIEPAQDLLPTTIEEKIISYGDNLVSGVRIRSFQDTLKDFEKKFGEESTTVERLKLQREELENFITRDEMHKLEVAAVQTGRTNIEKLMESAGKGVAEITIKFYPILSKEVVCFAGPGNNGGDAFVAARHLHRKGEKVTIVLLEKPKTLEATINLKRAKIDGVEIIEIKNPEELKNIKGEIAIDGIFGTGTKGEIKEPFKSAIERVNDFPIKVSIDVPSGMNPDTGEERNTEVKADLVICLGRFKKGLIGKYPVGRVQIVGIGT